MQPARFRQADISLVKIDNAKSMSPAVSSGRSAGSFPEQRLVIEPRTDVAFIVIPLNFKVFKVFTAIACNTFKICPNAYI